MDEKEQLNHISQTLFIEAEKLHAEGDINTSRVMFAAMMAAGAGALLDEDGGGMLKDLLKDIGEIIDQINVAMIKENGDGLN